MPFPFVQYCGMETTPFGRDESFRLDLDIGKQALEFWNKAGRRCIRPTAD